MKNFLLLALFSSVIFISACASNMKYPEQRSIQGANNSFLEVLNAPIGSVVYSNGLELGVISDKKGGNLFVTKSGMSKIIVSNNGAVLITKSVLVDTNSTVKVNVK